MKTSRSTRMMAAMWACQSVSASLSAGSETLTVRVSSRLRPLSRRWADPSGALVAAISWICWCRVGWLSLLWTISAMLALARLQRVFLAVQRIQRDDGTVGDTAFGEHGLRRRNLVGF